MIKSWDLPHDSYVKTALAFLLSTLANRQFQQYCFLITRCRFGWQVYFSKPLTIRGNIFCATRLSTGPWCMACRYRLVGQAKFKPVKQVLIPF